jgi:hypothetical protein
MTKADAAIKEVEEQREEIEKVGEFRRVQWLY